jgi:hypothetical protein
VEYINTTNNEGYTKININSSNKTTDEFDILINHNGVKYTATIVVNYKSVTSSGYILSGDFIKEWNTMFIKDVGVSSDYKNVTLDLRLK